MNDPNSWITGHGWLHTYRGHRFEPFSEFPGKIDIRDIAHALSNVCRYAGHPRVFYSVAEHATRIARELRRRGETRIAQLHGLHHDDSEAYLGDVPRPLKQRPEMAFYREAERRLQAKILEALDIPGTEPDAVKALDYEILGTEARQLFTLEEHHRAELPAPLEGVGGMGWKPERAEELFLAAHWALTHTVEGGSW